MFRNPALDCVNSPGMNSHAPGPRGLRPGSSGHSRPTTAATRCPRMPTLGHGRRHHTHLAAGLRRMGNPQHPRTSVPATPPKGGPLSSNPSGEGPLGGAYGGPARYPWLAHHGGVGNAVAVLKTLRTIINIVALGLHFGPKQSQDGPIWSQDALTWLQDGPRWPQD